METKANAFIAGKFTRRAVVQLILDLSYKLEELSDEIEISVKVNQGRIAIENGSGKVFYLDGIEG